MELGDLKVRISADITQLSQGIQQAQAKMQALGPKMQAVGSSMQSVGKSMSLAVTAPILLMGKLGLDELKDIQSANAQTAAAIANVGKGSLISAGHIREQAASLQILSGADDQAIQGAQNLLLRFANLNVKTLDGAKAFDRAAKLAVDMGVTMGGPEAAARKLGKALADPENALTRVGKEAGLTKAQMEALKKKMEGANTPAEKQAILLTALEGKFKGAAEAAGGTLGAKLEILKDRIAGVSAQFIEKLIPAVDVMVDGASKLLAWVERLSPEQQKWAAVCAVAAAAMGPLLIVVGSLVSAIGALIPVVAALLGPVGLVIAAVVLFGIALVKLWRTNEEFRDGVVTAWGAVKTGILGVLASLKSTITTWVGWARSFWSAYGEAIQGAAESAWGNIRTLIGGALTLIKGVIQTVLAVIRGDWSAAWDGIKTILSGAWDMIKGIVGLGLDVVRGLLSGAWALMRSAAQTAWDGIKGVISGAWDGIKAHTTASMTSMGAVMSTQWDGMKRNTVAAWEIIPDPVRDGIAEMASHSARIGLEVVEPLRQAFNRISGIVVTEMTEAKRTLAGFADDFKTSAINVGDAISDGVRAGMATLTEKLRSIGSSSGAAFAGGLKSAINDVVSRFNDFSIPAVSVLGKEVSPAISLPDLPYLARGGITSGPSIAGEAGPEAVIPLGGSAQNKSDAARVMGQIGMGSGVTQNFYVTNPVEDLSGFMRRARFEARIA